MLTLPAHFKEKAICLRHLLNVVFVFTQHLNFLNSWNELQQLQATARPQPISCE